MSQQLSVSDFKWVEDISVFTNDFIMNYDVNINEGYIFEATIRYPEKLYNKHKDLPFLPQKEKINKCQKLTCSVKNKEKYVVHIRALKQALKYWLILEEINRTIKFKQKSWLKPYTDLNKEKMQIMNLIKISFN